jgi:tryptophan synthase alpha chain
MSRIATVLQQLASEQKKAFIPYLTAGDPDIENTHALLDTLVTAGADIIELGVPFSDPMADGPVIQRACERALAQQITLQQILALVKKFRSHNMQTPIVLMGYLNPIEQMGITTFVDAAVDAGVDGVLVVDLPPEEAHGLHAALRAKQLDLIFLIAPTTTSSRMQQIAELASGYLYYVSLRGVTGASSLNTTEIRERVAQIRQVTQLPLAIGFGIKDAATAAMIAPIADGIIVGSALVEVIEQGGDDMLAAVHRFLTGIKLSLS